MNASSDSRSPDPLDEVLWAVPVQLIGTDPGVLLLRGAREVSFEGEHACEAIQIILSMTLREKTPRRKILEVFAEPDREIVGDLIDRLIERHFLIREGDPLFKERQEKENALDVFYWNFGADGKTMVDRMNHKAIAIVGVNAVTRRLAEALSKSDITNYEVVDYPLLRNLRFFDENGELLSTQWPENIWAPIHYEEWKDRVDLESLDGLVAASDFGGRHAMREWNELCVANDLLFLPIVLDRLTGYVGPLVIPHETACYECLRARENSHLEDPELARISEDSAFQRQWVQGSHPSMASILGDIAAVELTKFYTGFVQPRVGRLIEVNLLAPEVTTHRVLIVPRCAVCSPSHQQPKMNAELDALIPGNPLMEGNPYENMSK